MISTTCILAWAAVILLFPVIFLLWLSESQKQTIRRWHHAGLSQRKIAQRLGITRYEVRKALVK